MIFAFLLFVVLDLAGGWTQQRFALPIPGPLIGLIVLAACLCLWPQLATKGMRSTARILVAGMSMFFVPAGTGVITQMKEIRLQWIPICVGLCLSTLASLLVTAWVMHGLDSVLARWMPRNTVVRSAE